MFDHALVTRLRSLIIASLVVVLALGSLVLLPIGAVQAGDPPYQSSPAPGTTLNAGTTAVGTATTAMLNISSRYQDSDYDMDITHSVSGANAADFAVTPASVSVTFGQPKTLTITCTPSDSGTRVATLRVQADSQYYSSSYTYPITCEGTNLPTVGYGSNPAPGSTINVGSATVGQSSSTTLTVSETGNAALDVLGMSIEGAHAADFTATPTNFTIADGGASQNVTITCAPSADGTRTATLDVYYMQGPQRSELRGIDYSTASYTLSCVGNAAPAVGYGSSPAPGGTLDVGSAIVGQTTSSPLTVSETGNLTLQITSHSLSGTHANEFSVTPATLTIADGEQAKELTVTCAPSEAGTRTATLTVNHNASASPATYSLTCKGTAIATPGYDSTPAAGSTLNVGTAALGTSASAPLVIREIGTAALNITSVSLNGAHAADFQVTPATLSIPDGGAAQSLIIRCTPSATGARSATLSVAHNASGSPATYSLTCAGTAWQSKVYLPMLWGE